MFHSLVSLQKYIEAPFFQKSLNRRSFILDTVRVSEAYESTGLRSTLYTNILVFLRSSGITDAFSVRENTYFQLEYLSEFLH